LERAGQSRLPRRPAVRQGETTIHDRPAAAVADRIDIDVVEGHRHCEPKPEHAVGDRRRLSRPGPGEARIGQAATGLGRSGRLLNANRQPHERVSIRNRLCSLRPGSASSTLATVVEGAMTLSNLADQVTPMNLFKRVAIAAGALMASAAMVSGAYAQHLGQEVTPGPNSTDRMQQRQIDDRRTIQEAERIQNQTSRNNSRYDRRNRREREQTPAEAIEAAQAIATTAGLTCQVTEANRLGFTNDNHPMYEAACATGPGYIVVGSTPPQSFDCIELKSQADQARARDPNAEVGQQCAIEKNNDVVSVLQAYATEAGVTCTVDNGTVLGKSSDGAVIYEVGCGSAP